MCTPNLHHRVISKAENQRDYSTFGVLCQNETTVNENINNNPEYSIKIQSSQYNLVAFLEKEENPFTFRNLTPNTKASTGSPDAIWHPFLGIIF